MPYGIAALIYYYTILVLHLKSYVLNLTMKILIKSAQIIDKHSPYHEQEHDVLIDGHTIAEIGSIEQDVDLKIDAKGLKLSLGWFDMAAQFGEPGYEQREDLASGCEAAAAGGFSDVALLPNTKPVVQTKNEIGFIKSKSSHFVTQLHPMAAITIDTKGEELTDMIDLYEAGAVAFTDGDKPIWNSDILLKTLLYLQKFDGLLINKPEDKFLNLFGSMHEGIHSTMLGLKGMPRLSEELSIIRDIDILKYTGGRLHFANISSGRSVELIRNAKQEGLQITCDVAAHQLIFDDSFLHDFDTNFKVNPPFREQSDKDALIKGLKDGTIDIIVSAHHPHEEENKNLEFDLADFGIMGLQSFFSTLETISEFIPLPDLLEKITLNPRKLLKLELAEIKAGAKANLTLFDSGAIWHFDEKTNRSKSKNSPYFNQELKGKAVGVFNNGKYWLEEALERSEKK